MDKQKQFDYILFTDGSGREQDGFSGWSTQVFSQLPCINPRRRRMGAMTGSTVDRAEFTAFLEGLQMILEMDAEQHRIGNHRPEVLWYSDRENLVLSVSGKYGRKSSPDLWARFAYYESRMLIKSTHVSRETDFKEFQDCDLQSSTMRVVIKNYVDSIPPV